MGKPIGVKITRADKRGRKIILVMESDLYSYETFAVNPFYNEGDVKNQLQSTNFVIKVTEKKGEIKAEVSFGSSLSHFTRGYTQLHSGMGAYFLSRKDQAINWVQSEREEWFKKDRINQVLKQWESDKDFYTKLKHEIKIREKDIRHKKLIEAESLFFEALENLKNTMKRTDDK